MNSKTWDFEEHGGYLDPEDKVFMGRVTKRELLLSIKVSEEKLKRRKEAAANKAKFEAIQETCEKSSPNRTFEIVDAENIDPATAQSPDAELNRTYELDESQNPCLCPQIESKDCDTRSPPDANETFAETDEPDNRPHLISILSDPLKDVSNLNESLAQTRIGSDAFARNSARGSKSGAFAKGSLLDDTCTTIVAGCLQTPLLEKIRESGRATRPGDKSVASEDESLETTLTNESSAICGLAGERVIKLSDTFITELLPENCLINSSLNESAAQRTPDVFRQKRNEIWRKGSPAPAAARAKKSIGVPLQSKLPLLKKTPSKKLLPGMSPVADYIHRGITVQSASKSRHSYCVHGTGSKSEQKPAQTCRIPVSTNVFAKRKLQMVETKFPVFKK